MTLCHRLLLLLLLPFWTGGCGDRRYLPCGFSCVALLVGTLCCPASRPMPADTFSVCHCAACCVLLPLQECLRPRPPSLRPFLLHPRLTFYVAALSLPDLAALFLSCRPIVALGASSCVQLCVLLLAFQCAASPLPAISCPVHLPTSPRRLCPYASSAPLLVPWHLPFASCAVAHSAALCLCLPFC